MKSSTTLITKPVLKAYLDQFRLPLPVGKFSFVTGENGELQVVAACSFGGAFRHEGVGRSKASAYSSMAESVMHDESLADYFTAYNQRVEMELQQDSEFCVSAALVLDQDPPVTGEVVEDLNKMAHAACTPYMQTAEKSIGPSGPWMVTAIVANKGVTTVGTSKKLATHAAAYLLLQYFRTKEEESYLFTIDFSRKMCPRVSENGYTTMYVADPAMRTMDGRLIRQIIAPIRAEEPFNPSPLFPVAGGVQSMDRLEVGDEQKEVQSEVSEVYGEKRKRKEEKTSVSGRKPVILSLSVPEDSGGAYSRRGGCDRNENADAIELIEHRSPRIAAEARRRFVGARIVWQVLVDIENVPWVRDVKFPPWCKVYGYRCRVSNHRPLDGSHDCVVVTRVKNAADHAMTFGAAVMAANGKRHFVLVSRDKFACVLREMLCGLGCTVMISTQLDHLYALLDELAHRV